MCSAENTKSARVLESFLMSGTLNQRRNMEQCCPVQKISNWFVPCLASTHILLRTHRNWFLTRLPCRKPVQSHSNSPGSHKIVLAWLSTCLEEHGHCNELAVRTHSSTPDRLLHIMTPSSIRLSMEHRRDVSYVALSYCWGAPEIFSTTKENYEDHLKGIPIPELPKTFREAIEMSQVLGCEYVWIDSICIIQHDKQDFAVQSSKMGDIYANAMVVLSADSASNVDEGFHRQRENASFTIHIPPWKRSLHQRDQNSRNDNVHLGCNEQNLDVLYARPHLGKDFIWKSGDHHSYVKAPTNDRAWCFQEQRLARRIIHFTKDEMYWQCGSISTCECGRKDSETKYTDFIPQLLARFWNPPKTEGMMWDYSHPISFWGPAVEKFATRRLTNPTDRLPALAGLASRLHCNELGDYHVGMWRNYLPLSLLWDARSNVEKLVSETYIGPTWSWISYIGAIHSPVCLGGYYVSICKLIQIRTLLGSANPFGAITAAWIRITGLTSKATVVTRKRGDIRELRETTITDLCSGKMTVLNFYPDGRVSSAKGESVLPHFEEVMLFIVALAKTTGHWRGLVLIKSCKQQGAFERMGTFTSRGNRKGRWVNKTVTII
jgi:hypothetical protein